MNIAVCDDDLDDLNLLLFLLRQYNDTLPITTFSSAQELLTASKQTFFDLIFLDIEMHAPNGFEVAQVLMQNDDKPLIVFVTKSSEYTLRGYGIAFRYLTKPISYSAISRIMSLAIEQIAPQKITITSRGQTFLLSLRNIYYMEISNHNITVFAKDETISFRGTLKDMEQLLPKDSFAKPHNSYIINLAEIRTIGSNTLVMTNGALLPISQRYRKSLEKSLFYFMRR